MKIRRVDPEGYNRVYGLFRKGFPELTRKLRVLEDLHRNERDLLEWVCIHKNKNIAYIAFSNVYNGHEVCGLHLLYLLVKPEFQGRGIGTELLHFALRQPAIATETVYTHGHLQFFARFGFKPCPHIGSPLAGRRKQLLSINQKGSKSVTLNYDIELLKK